ncbi:MAG: hypothetical protein MUF87_16860 [Anaerolineae bacterium]|jgi:hypothetical protein|nr:hypothetical protein [Anaerolineae bacterium]
MIERLQSLAQRKAAEFAARPELIACALTGSLPRGRVWAGSDLDFYGFWHDEDDDFEDGVEDGIYWEINLEPLSFLESIDPIALLQPPPFSPDEFGDTPLEILWGAQVLFDHDGALTRAVAEVQRLTEDRAWLRQRAQNYLAYGQACLADLAAADPIRAILDARRIAIVYGINPYWMQRGELLSSVIRIPERLADHPSIQTGFRAIFNLEGQAGWDRFFADYQQMPPEIREEGDPDVFQEILPAVQLGMADGGLCHFRFIAEGWLPLETIDSLMGFESDRVAQKVRVLDQTAALLAEIARL